MSEYGMDTPCPVGPGGNHTLTNQDEADIFRMTLAAIPVRGGAEPMWQENDAAVGSIFSEPDVGGS